MRFLQSTVDAVYTNVKLQCVGAEDVYGTLQTELTFNSKEGGSTFLPAYTDLCSDSTKFDDAQRVYFCKNCLLNCPSLVEQAPKNILIVADVKAPNSRVSWFHVQTPVSSIRETGKQCNVENQNPASSSNMEETSTDALRSFSKTSVLFVSISFIILMVISLAWLVFYYVQRFRYAHAKDRLQRRLFNAARKALTRIPTMVIAPGMHHELQSDCAVCLDPYQLQDVVRLLPCKHIYHKSCIDPWLLEHRTCPMCKNDILKHFGGINEDFTLRLELGERDDEHHHRHHHHHHHRTAMVSADDVVSPEANSESSDSQGFSFDHSEHTENFSFSTPAVAPQLVLNASNAKSFVMPMSTRSSMGSESRVMEPRPQTSQPTSNFRSARTNRDHRGSLSDLAAGSVAVPPGQRTKTVGATTPGGSPGQIVNLVQVKSRSASITRAATIRKESLPTPIEITTSALIPPPTSSITSTSSNSNATNSQVV
ncbi:unnamed protein product [Caenorhabditis sp. 36 PRJEB53466]|nr:unnamed protein product [Caenorhabditis sp. 36 PRJEB53466]